MQWSPFQIVKIANPILLIGLGLGLATDLQLQGQGWQRVLHLNDVAGSAIGAGLDDTLYAALVPGQVFRSTDNGLSWIGITIGLLVVVAAIGSFVYTRASSTTVGDSSRLQQDAATALRAV